MSQQPAQPITMDDQMRRFREYVTASIALIIIIGSIVIFAIAIVSTSNAEQFNLVKDVLLFVNPVLGLVLGYYFTKAATEARAEKAETTAISASNTANLAVRERDTALDEAAASQEKVEEAHDAIREMGEAAERLVQPVEAGTLGADGGFMENASARQDLLHAWRRAQKLL